MMRCLVEAGGVGWWEEFEAVLDKFGLKGDLGGMPGSMDTWKESIKAIRLWRIGGVNWGRGQVWSGSRK